MPHYQVKMSQQYSRPVEEIYAWLADHDSLGPLLKAPIKRIRAGEGGPNGVGSVRRIGPPLVGIEETVTALEENRRIEYRITRNGGPVRNHRGQLAFSPQDGGSRVDWTIDFDALPGLGGLLERLLHRVIGGGLKRHAA